jgi:hypothetical protein
MPIIAYTCECGLVMKKFYRKAKEVPSCKICTGCGKESKRSLSAPNSTSITVVDNGVQARSTEVNLEIVESIKDRSTKDFRED